MKKGTKFSILSVIFPFTDEKKEKVELPSPLLKYQQKKRQIQIRISTATKPENRRERKPKNPL